jgi:hypothetical protein
MQTPCVLAQNPETVCRLGTFCINTVDQDKPKLQNALHLALEYLQQTLYTIQVGNFAV